jgi:hypothetical protein
VQYIILYLNSSIEIFFFALFFRTDEMMRGYCEEALRYGKVPLPLEEKPRHVTVILNPAAKKKYITVHAMIYSRVPKVL